MKVCYVADYGTKISGGHQSLLNLINEVKCNGIEPFIVCHKNWELITYAESIGINTKVVSGKIYTVSTNDNGMLKYAKYIVKRVYNSIHYRQVKKWLKDNKIELVHLNSMLSSEMWAKAAYECGIPYVWHIREFLDADFNRRLVNKNYIYKYVKRASTVIAISTAIKTFWDNETGIECNLVYNGLQKDDYFDETDKFTDNCLRCVVVGRITEGKGQIDVVKAVEKLHKQGINVKLTLVGYRDLTEYEKSIKQYVDDNHLNDYIQLMDYTYNLKSIRARHDIGITSSRAEAFGRVTIENMLSGMLAIGTNSGGTPELIEDKVTGYLYEFGNYEQLAKLIQDAWANIDETRKIAKEGQRIVVERFTINKTAENVMEIYHRVLQKS